jgi:TetR/AcrR family transcriptional regulator, cholesterol catabolism regulator
VTDLATGARDEQGTDRRAQIIEVAARLFAEKGYQGTSIQEIAAAVGMLKGSLYYHIQSKEDLLLAIIEKAHQDGITMLRERLARPHPDALSRLRSLVEGHICNLTSNLVAVTVFFQEFRLLGQQERRRIVAERDEYEEEVRKILRDGQSEGTMCPDLDVPMTARTILGALNWTYHWYKPEGSLHADEVASILADLALRTVRCEGHDHTKAD